MPMATQSRALWSWCLASAFRTALACTIVGCTTFYGPQSFRHQVAFPAFSYVNVILIITDATLGDALYSCWLAFYVTVQTVGPAILTLWLIGPARFTASTISLAVALASFSVTLPEGTHLIAKRIGLGQIVIVYVIAYEKGVHTQPIMHPLHVAASTALGVLACVLALLLPYPRLASWEVKDNSKVFAENVSERLKLYLKAFTAQDGTLAMASVSKAKCLASAATKLLQNIKRYQENMKWERIPFFGTHYMKPGGRFQEVETVLRGMEMAITNISSFPATNTTVDGGSKEGVFVQLEQHLTQSIRQIKNISQPNFDSITVPESNVDDDIKMCLQKLHTTPSTFQDFPSLFFLFCVKLLHCTSLPKPTNSPCQANHQTPCKQDEFSIKTSIDNWVLKLKTKRLMPAFKVSLSLGLAILFGSIFSRENGFWSGLPVAVSLVTTREPTFKIANVKVQGTVLGTIYGVLGCFVFERFLQIRFLSLLPWIVVANLLRRSKLYGQAGGISAVIGALLILGRKNYGPPSEFAIARITETFIGLSCSVIVELLFQPARAASLAKVQLSKSLARLHSCIGEIGLNKGSLVEQQRLLKMEIGELGKFIGEAEAEPNFWFLPFNGGCYSKLIGSLSKMVDLLLFSTESVGFLAQESGALSKLEGDLQLFKEMVGPLIKCLQDVTLLKSLTFLDAQLRKKNVSYDVELGKSPNRNVFRVSCGGDDGGDEMKKVINSYVRHLKEVVDNLDEGGNNGLKSEMVMNLSALGFCLSNLVVEIREIEKAIHELLQFENPSYHINLFEISCKYHALYE